MIPLRNIDEILDATKIEDVISDFVDLKRNGANYKACCPFHNEKTPSFIVSPAKGIYKCFGCGKSGSAVRFLMDHESLSYVDALKYLARKYNIKVEERELSPEEIARQQESESLLLVNEFALKTFRKNLETDEGRLVGRAYFHSRNLTDETIDKYGLGWCLSTRDAFSKKAIEAGYKLEFLAKTGLTIVREDGSFIDRFYDRAMFPIHSLDGRIIAFGGRTLRKDTDKIAKYQNSIESEIYEKRKSLYGIYFAKNQMAKERKCYLVEGYLDVLQMHQRGITNVVASSGTSLTTEQVKLIHRFADRLTIIYDGDGAGIKAALRGLKLAIADDLEVKVVLLEGGQDPDDFAKSHTLEEVQQYIDTHEEDFITFQSRMLLKDVGDDPYSKGSRINEITDTIALIPDPVKRELSIKKVSRMFDLSVETIVERVRNTRREAAIHEIKTTTRKEEALRREASERTGQTRQEVSLKSPVAAKNITDASEREILEYVIVNGCMSVDMGRDKGVCTIAEYIDDELLKDGLEISNPLYSRAYNLFFDYYEEGLTEGQIHNRLIENEDPDIRDLTADLLNEKYQITVANYRNQLTGSETRLRSCVPNAIVNFKIKVIQKKNTELAQQLKEASPEQQESILQQIRRLNELKVNIEKNNKRK